MGSDMIGKITNTKKGSIMTLFWIIAFAICIVFLVMCRKINNQGKHTSVSKTFEDYGFSLRDNQLWYHDVIVDSLDPKTFQVIDEYYAKDAKQVIFYQTYRDSRSYFLTKKNELFHMPGADPDSFAAIGDGYGRDKSKAYYQGESFPVRHLSSLTVINVHFIKDDMAAYLDREEIKGSDGKSFELLSSIYAKDSGQVFYYQFASSGQPETYVISQFPQSFTIIEHPYAKDEKNVFYFGEKLPTNFPESFEILGNGFSRDMEQVYFKSSIIKDADRKSIQVFPENQQFTGEGAYAKDSNHIYYKNHVIQLVDKNSFEIFNENYSKDRNHVYFQHKIIKDCDLFSFEVFPHDMGDADARDKNHHYHLGKKLARE